MTAETDLLRQYAESGSEAAFEELVRRNLDLVFATAVRILGDSHRAEDVAQSVFIDLVSSYFLARLTTTCGFAFRR